MSISCTDTKHAIFTDCKRTCKNGGSLNAGTCTCTCSKPYYGPTCACKFGLLKGQNVIFKTDLKRNLYFLLFSKHCYFSSEIYIFCVL